MRKLAIDTYRAAVERFKGDYSQCPQPCKFVKGVLYMVKSRRKMKPDDTGKLVISVQIFLEGMIQTTKMDYNYGFISLVAELGGYVGLFLGVAIVELHGIFEHIANRFLKVCTAEKLFFKLVKYALTGLCLGICLWQADVCFRKYLEKVQGLLKVFCTRTLLGQDSVPSLTDTSVELRPISSTEFPDITICIKNSL